MTIELERASEAAPRPDADWERDWNGRPKILPDPSWIDEQTAAWRADRADDEGRVCYTRVTTFAEALQDASALSRWKMRRVALGMGCRPDYVTAAAALSTDDRDKQALDDLAEKALEASGPNAADVGTAVHSFTERLDRGEPLGAVPEQYRPDVDAYARVAAHLTMVEWECRTVCDELEVAGTPDRLGFCDVPDPDGIVDELRIIDTKTGKVDYSAGKFSTQLATYRRSKLYDPVTGARTAYEDRHGKPVSRWGLIVHVPAGSGRAELLWIDLEHGDAGAQLASRVREWRTGATAAVLLRPVFARAPRPAPGNGTCRGRLANGKACVYRAKDGTAWCGRHQAQQTELDRWLAENPGVDPDSGEDATTTVDVPQPATQPVEDVKVYPQDTVVTVEARQAAADRSVAGQLARRDHLQQLRDEADDATDRAAAYEARHGTEALADLEAAAGADLPDVLTEQAADELEALVAMAPVADDVPRYDGPPFDVDLGNRLHVTSAPDDAGPDRGVDADLAAALGSGTDRCPTTDLIVEQCACPVHRPDLAAVGDDGVERDTASLRELPLEGPYGYPAGSLAEAAERDQWTHYTTGQLPAVVGTYALDPAMEVNGNPRPVAYLQTAEDSVLAADRARASILAQIAAARWESELLTIYRQHQHLWTPELTAAAGARSAELADQRARERPEAALLAAIRTAPDQDALRSLWVTYSRGRLWTDAVDEAAGQRYTELAAGIVSGG